MLHDIALAGPAVLALVSPVAGLVRLRALRRVLDRIGANRLTWAWRRVPAACRAWPAWGALP